MGQNESRFGIVYFAARIAHVEGGGGILSRDRVNPIRIGIGLYTILL